MSKTINIDDINCEKFVFINPNQISSAEGHVHMDFRCILLRMQNGDSILLNETIDSFWLKAEGDE